MASDKPTDQTRKQRREQARQERKALEAAQASAAARRKRLGQLGGVVAVAVVIVIVVLIATSGGSSSKSGIPTSKKAANQTVTEVTSLLAGIPQSGNILGHSNAPVTMQYFGDLECPICREFTLGALPSLVRKYVREGKLKIEYRAMETATREPETFRTQQVAALAAGKQNKMWDYVELFYHEQGEEDSGYVNERYLQNLASQVPGLDLASWSAARDDSAFSASITTDAQTANDVGFTGTPSFLLGKTGAPLQKFEYSSLTDPSSFEQAINKLLA